MSFKPAARRNARLRLAISGPAGTGKTYSAILLAKIFDPMPAVMDSERGSAEKYAIKAGTSEAPGNWRFLTSALDEKNPQDYLRVLGEAAAARMPILVIDSYSHSWIGALEQVDRMGGSKFSTGWKVVSPIVSRLVDAILAYPGHVIATMRSKTAFEIEKDDRGKAIPRKIGMATVARDGTDYEFDVMLDLDLEGNVTVSKTRCSALANQAFRREDMPKIGAILKAWLDEGAPLSPLELAIEAIRAVTSVEQLQGLKDMITALTPEDRKAIKSIYESKKAALIQAQTDAADLAGIE
jgi:hypothetical protein